MYAAWMGEQQKHKRRDDDRVGMSSSDGTHAVHAVSYQAGVRILFFVDQEQRKEQRRTVTARSTH
jgi:hypothetical protein